jgi:predicted site-specific integrase-resolvase
LKEAAAYYDRDGKTIDRWRKEGKVHGKKNPGGRWLIELRPL